MEIGLTWCGDPDAFWRWPLETQERVLGWYRARQPAPKKRKKVFQPRTGDTVDPAARAFWGL
jgi:hypothetical protein